MKLASFLIVMAAYMFTASPKADRQEVELLVKDISILDPRSGTFLSHCDIFVSGTKIAKIVPSGALQASAKTIINGTGTYAIPGLFYNRVHAARLTERSAGLFFALGLTSVSDIGTQPAKIENWRKRIAYGKFYGPRIVHACGPMLESGVIPNMGHACTCVPKTSVTLELKQSSAVFSGKVSAIKKNDRTDDPFTAVEVVFEVGKTWKGVKKQPVSVFTSSHSATCALKFEKGQSYIVYANNDSRGLLITDICTRTRKLKEAHDDLDELSGAEIPVNASIDHSGNTGYAQDEIKISLANATRAEQQTREQLQRLIKTYDLKKWIFTRTIIIDEKAIPHSHPVLTLNARHLKDDELLLSTFVHEQIHWFVIRDQEKLGATIKDLRALFPKAPAEFPEGAGTERSTDLHIPVVYLEYRAVRELLGELRAKQVMEFWATDHYTWIYKTVMERPSDIGNIMLKHKLIPN